MRGLRVINYRASCIAVSNISPTDVLQNANIQNKFRTRVSDSLKTGVIQTCTMV